MIDNSHYTEISELQSLLSEAIKAGDTRSEIETLMDIGHLAYEDKNYSLANMHYGLAAKRIRATGQLTKRLTDALGKRGRALRRMKRLEPAAELFHEAVQAAKESHQPLEAARWLDGYGQILRLRGDLEGAEQTFQEALSLYQSLGERGRVGAADQEGNLGLVARERGDVETAANHYRRAFETSKALNDLSMINTWGTNLGNALTDLHRTHEASIYYEEAFRAAVREDNADRIVNTATQLAVSYRKNRRFDRAAETLLRTQKLFSQPQKKYGLASMAIGDLYDAKEWAKMRDLGMEMVTILKQFAGTEVKQAECFYNIAIAHRMLGVPRSALAAERRALNAAASHDAPELIIKYEGQLALILTDLGEFAEALPYAQRVLKFARTMGPEYENYIALTEQNLVRIYTGMENHTEAISTSRSLIERCRQSKSLGPYLIGALESLAMALHAKGELAAACEQWEAIIEQSRMDLAADPLIKALAHLAAKDKSKKDFDAAFKRYCGIMYIKERLRKDIEDVFDVSAWRIITSEAENFPNYLQELVTCGLAAKRIEETVYMIDRLRSPELVEILADRRETYDPSEGTASPWSHYKHQKVQALYRLRELEKEEATLNKRRMAAQDLDTAKNKVDGPLIFGHIGGRKFFFPESLEKMFEEWSLEEGEVIVETILTDHGTEVFFIDCEGKVHYPGPFGDLTRQYTIDLYNRFFEPYMDARKQGVGLVRPEVKQALQDILTKLGVSFAAPLAEQLKKLNAHRVFLVPHLELQSLPLGAGPVKGEDTLQDLFEISILPTASGFGHLRQSRTPQRQRSVFMVNVDVERHRRDMQAWLSQVQKKGIFVLDPEGNLDFAEAELALILASGICKRIQPTILPYEKAHVNEFNNVARQFGLLHIISHGAFAETNPYQSGIFLYAESQSRADRLKTAAQIFGELDIPGAQLVTLSGCETGLARPNSNEELISLPAAFLAAGSRTVLASQWMVNDLSTAMLMAEFYKASQEPGNSVSRAMSIAAQNIRMASANDLKRWLRDAKRLLKTGKFDWDVVPTLQALENACENLNGSNTIPPFAHPVFWAAFFVTGDGGIRLNE